jgi:hypothetical protein
MLLSRISFYTLLVLLLSSCDKNYKDSTPSTADLANSSIVQVYIATVNASRNLFFVDGVPQSASLMSSGSFFPSTGSYGAAIPGGLRSFAIRDTSSTSTQLPLNFAQNLATASHYTVFAYDTITAPKQKTVNTNITVPSDASCRIRFANFAYNGNAITPSIDIVSVGKNEIVANNVRYTDVTNFITHPSLLAGEGFQVRESGTSNILATVSSVSLEPKRSYTIVYRGSHRATSGTSTRAVSVFVNY